MKYSIRRGVRNLGTFLAGGFDRFCDYMDRASIESAELSLRAREPRRPYEIPMGCHLSTVNPKKLQHLIEDSMDQNPFWRMA
ncbi:hypothetical protein CMI48_03205 [Candidatus Pacearchaeota archaeon]|nr:hypothetical protein [Candidatus Pacearchaeota archaeon]